MPLIIKCEKCDTVLYEGRELKPPYEVLEKYNGRCPRCGRRLSHELIDIKIREVE